MNRILVWYRVDNGPIMQGYAERTCSGDVIFDSVDSVTPIEGAAAIPAPALPAETRIAPTAYDCYGQPTIRVHDTCAIEILRKIEAGLQSASSDTALLEGITRIEALLQTIAANTVPVVKNIVQLSTGIQSLDSGISDFVDVTMALDSTKEYSLNVIGYELFPLVQTSVNRQDSTTVRVVVENQSGNVIPATTILITATSLN